MSLAASGIQGPDPGQMPRDYIIPDEGPNSAETLLENLNLIDEGHQLIPPDQKRILIALMLMVNKADPTYRFNFDVCEQFLAETIAPIIASFNTGADLGSEVARINEEIYQHMIDMAIASNAPVGSPTILKVQWARRVFLYLLGMGVSYGVLRTVVPDTIVAAYLEYANYLFQVMTTGGMKITPAAIASGAASNPPFSMGVFASNVGRAAASAASSAAAAVAYGAADLTAASFMALARGAGSCFKLVIGSAAYAACKASEYLTLNLLTSGVKAVVGVGAVRAADRASAAVGSEVGAAGESVYAAAMGASDEAIANFIDRNAAELKAQIRAGATRENLIAAITGAVEIFQAVLQNLTAGIEASKERMMIEIGQSIRDMAEITSNLTRQDPNWIPNRFVGPSITEIIQNAFGEEVLLDAELFRTHLGELISILSSMRLETDADIDEVAKKLHIPPPPNQLYNKLRALITLWKLSVDKIPISRSVSVMHVTPGMSYVAARTEDIRSLRKKKEKRKVRNEGESASLPEEYNVTPDLKDPFSTRGATKNKQLGPPRKVSTNSLAVKSEVNPTKELEEYFNNDENLRNANTELGIYNLIASQSREKQLEIIEALKKTASKSLLGVFDEQLIDNMRFNTQKIKETVDRLLGRVMLGSMDIDDDDDDVNSQDRQSASAASAVAPNNYYNLGGRKKKSMRHRKRRSTIRRKKGRRVGRKTRKGKKKRYTKKRR
jgi:hypothetical protein